MKTIEKNERQEKRKGDCRKEGKKTKMKSSKTCRGRRRTRSKGQHEVPEQDTGLEPRCEVGTRAWTRGPRERPGNIFSWSGREPQRS